jgi:hypothetical protein
VAGKTNIISDTINSDKMHDTLSLTVNETKERKKAKICFYSQCYMARKTTLEAPTRQRMPQTGEICKRM